MNLKTLKEIFPVLIRYMYVGFCVFYVFSVIGMELYAGKLHPTNVYVQDTSYGALKYYALNFDTLDSSLMVRAKESACVGCDSLYKLRSFVDML